MECKHNRIGFVERDGIFWQECAICNVPIDGVPIECPHCTTQVVHANTVPFIDEDKEQLNRIEKMLKKIVPNISECSWCRIVKKTKDGYCDQCYKALI